MNKIFKKAVVGSVENEGEDEAKNKVHVDFGQWLAHDTRLQYFDSEQPRVNLLPPEQIHEHSCDSMQVLPPGVFFYHFLSALTSESCTEKKGEYMRKFS